ncbi:uncharacterized protein LOC106078194 isoform X5 [Biomphalaria glabrata]|uniref:Uncharacterized protein LOC106078194 isoform X5 n=1 Tax=Biomphalaria glabrata TaxID=6526 RepID=A0A9W2YSF7_BIOGL|nr:uncharacterized protein LOC106078194 isoform X5 [Biomphalaria glabrata]
MRSRRPHIAALIIFAVKAVTVPDVCSPALKRKEYSFQGNFHHTINEPLEIVWLRNKTPVSMCQSRMACYDYSDIKTSTTITMSGDGSVQYKLIIRNVTDVDETIWSMKYLGLASLRKQEPLFSCKLFVYEYPAPTLVDCPMMLEENTMLNCTCAKNNETEVDLKYSWFQTNGSLINNGGNVLSLPASKQNSGQECRGQTSTGEESVPVVYDPLIIARAKLLDCVLNSTESGLTLICVAQKVYPSANCDFTVGGNNLPLDPVYIHLPRITEPLYYNTQCSVTLTDLTPGYYDIVVSVYPNVTGSDSDKIYSVKDHFIYKIESDEESRHETNVIFNEVIICLTLCLLILIVILHTTILIRRSINNSKQTVPGLMKGKNEVEKKNVDHNFNDVDHIISDKENIETLINLVLAEPDLNEMGPLLKIKQKEMFEKL